MDFLDFRDVSFRANTNIGRLCEDLNNIISEGIWHDRYNVRNTEWLWLVNNIVAAMNSDKILCGSFGIYPSFVAGILNSVNKIHFYVLCSKQPDYTDYIGKCVAGKECCICYMSNTNDYFQLSSGSKTIAI
jgi:hypothetical protein